MATGCIKFAAKEVQRISWKCVWGQSGEKILRINPVRYFSSLNVLKETKSGHWHAWHCMCLGFKDESLLLVQF